MLSVSGDEPGPTRRVVVAEAVPASCSFPASRGWIEKVNRIRWVAYSSPHLDSDQGFYQPTPETIYQDLTVLRKAQFTGLITYGSAGIMGTQFPGIAQSLGFRGIIMGIWSPTSQDELNNAQNAASLPIVLGYSIGNEGLSGARDRYSISILCSAIADLRSRTGRPVATSEDVDTYDSRPGLLSVGDWLFPIAHPYWHSTKYPQDAVQWEQAQYSALQDKTGLFVFFKEVGLPTSGAYGLSDFNQDLFYRGLAETDVRFAYFEAFDQPSKTHASVEPHWGIFQADLGPKLLGWNLMGYRLFTADPGSDFWVQECSGRNRNQCIMDVHETELVVGKDLRDKQYRSILSFNTSGLPDNAVITSIKLKLKSTGVAGVSPLNNRHGLMVDICTSPSYRTVRYQTIESPNGLNCNDNVGTLDPAPNSGWYTADLRPEAFQSLNLTGVTRFRLRISGIEAMDSARAYMLFDTGATEISNGPMLSVHYALAGTK
ncbi:MAG TPA: hypothetical protein VLX61_16615 [Anaerolineales bacterium]|nr:hypothetical protein [Anaerolineales bacterium]